MSAANYVACIPGTCARPRSIVCRRESLELTGARATTRECIGVSRQAVEGTGTMSQGGVVIGGVTSRGAEMGAWA
jgi:hypothetical protein